MTTVRHEGEGDFKTVACRVVEQQNIDDLLVHTPGRCGRLVAHRASLASRLVRPEMVELKTVAIVSTAAAAAAYAYATFARRRRTRVVRPRGTTTPM